MNAAEELELLSQKPAISNWQALSSHPFWLLGFLAPWFSFSSLLTERLKSFKPPTMVILLLHTHFLKLMGSASAGSWPFPLWIYGDAQNTAGF